MRYIFVLISISIIFLTPINSQAQTYNAMPHTGTTFIDDYGYEMVLVPGGTFTMGVTDEQLLSFCEVFSTTEEAVNNCIGYFNKEAIIPGYTAKVETFWIDKYEVTTTQYNDCPGGIGERCPDNYVRDEKYFGPNQPQSMMTWYEAEQFCNLRNARLPTEEEWEYAASGPDDLMFPWGNAVSDDYFPVRNTAYDVGTMDFNVSWAGVYDMAGNVWEWTYNYYSSYETGKPIEVGGYSHGGRVSRGGSWGWGGSYHTTFYRYGISPFTRAHDIGFRCAQAFIEDEN